jgi:SAM-dependent methyltransferase
VRSEPLASVPLEDFGNLEANLRFLDRAEVLRPGSRVLEIGSGRGSLLHALLSKGLNASGVEVSAERIAEATARFGSLPICQVTGTSLPFQDAEFDVVLSFDVFEHIRDSDAHLNEVRRVLKPNGWYLLQTPSKWSNTVFETIRWRSFTRWQADHCALHTPGQLERRFRRHGFESTFADVPVVTTFYREKVRRHLGWPGLVLLTAVNPDRWPVRWRTNLYVRARKSASANARR